MTETIILTQSFRFQNIYLQLIFSYDQKNKKDKKKEITASTMQEAQSTIAATWLEVDSRKLHVWSNLWSERKRWQSKQDRNEERGTNWRHEKRTLQIVQWERRESLLGPKNLPLTDTYCYKACMVVYYSDSFH